jgi:hypothetical protein
VKPRRGKRKGVPKREREDPRVPWPGRGSSDGAAWCLLLRPAREGLGRGAAPAVPEFAVLAAGIRTASLVGRRDRLDVCVLSCGSVWCASLSHARCRDAGGGWASWPGRRGSPRSTWPTHPGSTDCVPSDRAKDACPRVAPERSGRASRGACSGDGAGGAVRTRKGPLLPVKAGALRPRLPGAGPCARRRLRQRRAGVRDE